MSNAYLVMIFLISFLLALFSDDLKLKKIFQVIYAKFLFWFSYMVDYTLNSLSGNPKKQKKIDLTGEQIYTKDYATALQERLVNLEHRVPTEHWSAYEDVCELIHRHLHYWLKRREAVNRAMTELENRRLELEISIEFESSIAPESYRILQGRLLSLVQELIDLEQKIRDAVVAVNHLEGEVEAIEFLHEVDPHSDLAEPALYNIAKEHEDIQEEVLVAMHTDLIGDRFDFEATDNKIVVLNEEDEVCEG
jgi:hypothetical protein